METFKDKGIAAAGKKVLQIAAKEGSNSGPSRAAKSTGRVAESWGFHLLLKDVVIGARGNHHQQLGAGDRRLAWLASKRSMPRSTVEFFTRWLSSYADKEGTSRHHHRLPTSRSSALPGRRSITCTSRLEPPAIAQKQKQYSGNRGLHSQQARELQVLRLQPRTLSSLGTHLWLNHLLSDGLQRHDWFRPCAAPGRGEVGSASRQVQAQSCQGKGFIE